MVLQKVVEEGHVEVTDMLIDDNNAIIQVRVPRESLDLPITGHLGTCWPPCPRSTPCGRRSEVRGGDSGQTLLEPLSLAAMARALGA